jgi:hypothetical protein
VVGGRVALHGGRQGCGSWQRLFFDNAMGLGGGGGGLLGGGCDVRRGLTSTISLVGCGATCWRWPLWQRVLGRAAKGASMSEVACWGVGRGSRRR